jgi:type II secretory ATPase GspE/PulE/Tfp pilus assembly ATPase PilB-like protein
MGSGNNGNNGNNIQTSLMTMEKAQKPTLTLEQQRLRQPQHSRLLRTLMDESPSARDAAHTRALAGAMLEDAVRENASDIHLDPVEGGYQLRLRIDGALVDTVLLQPDQGLHVIRAFKAHADLDAAYTMKPQDGRAEFQVGDRVVAGRVATAPTVLGEKLALRLLPTELARLTLNQLGLSPKDYEQITRAMHDARGMILVSGPTGAGKTTTLYAFLNELKQTNRAIVTIEDPVEYVVEGVAQLQVNEKQGLTFAEGVKGLLRLDPDIIMMGEMRDAVSARAALDAADSGHVFLSTLHARDVAGTITALRNFGLADHEIAATLDLIVAQRLVRRLCPACRRQEPPTPTEVNWLKFYSQPVPKLTWHAVGCAQCGNSGYRGRIGIFEVYRLREEDADLVLQHADEHTLRRNIRRYGTLSLVEDDLAKVADGITSLGELQAAGGLGFCAPPPANGLPTKRKSFQSSESPTAASTVV